MTSSTVQTSKSIIRREMKHKLSLLTKEEKSKQSEEVTKKLVNLEKFQTSKRVSIFLSTNLEISTEQILKRLFSDEKQCFVPRCNNNHMDMVKLYSWDDFQKLPTNKWGIKEPLEDEKRENALETGGLDLIIMPGLAFTKTGKRLGYGKGFYDGFLLGMHKLALKIPTTIAIAFREQILPDLPVEQHDFKADLVLYSR